MSRLSVAQIQNILSSVAPKHEHFLYEIETSNNNSIGLIIRYYHCYLK